MAKRIKIDWRSETEEHDFPAAQSYLSLIYPEDEVRRMLRKLKKAPIVRYKAKDIFRASRLPLLGMGNSEVRRDREKILARRRLSPLLLVRNEQVGEVVIADGYHRLCAVYGFDEDAVIHCKII